jgi:hypothetical protein
VVEGVLRGCLGGEAAAAARGELGLLLEPIGRRGNLDDVAALEFAYEEWHASCAEAG